MARHLPGNTLVHVKTLWVSTFPDSLPQPTPDSNLKPSLETKSSILKVCHMMFSLPGSKLKPLPTDKPDIMLGSQRRRERLLLS